MGTMYGMSGMTRRWMSTLLAAALIVALLAMAVVPLTQSKASAAISTEPMIAAGARHSLALKNDGTVWAWGQNNYGQLGNGTTSGSSSTTATGDSNTTDRTPVQVSGLNDVIAISAGELHSLALKSDGTVWAWGYNGSGQLGDGTTTNRSTPVQVSGLTNVIAITGGCEYHSLALKSDGTVWAWGNNSSGQLGNDTTTNSSTPVQAIGLSGVSAIGAGYEHSVALKSDGTVWAWGDNYYGQLGDGTTTNRSVPVQVMASSSAAFGAVASISVGFQFCIAQQSNGSVWTWGRNDGQLGDGTTTNRNRPGQVSSLSNVSAIAAGHYHAFAIKNDGTLLAWGGNGYGKLGDGTTTNRSTPVQVNGLSGASIVVGGNNYSLALKSDGTVWAWGGNSYGQLGDGTTTNRSTPAQL
ncbi:MAG: RCC1 repeat-containing protein, partial [Dehalococcoidia bacterium]|nr:RCC1 repeat-containing protein [Dehalococcoidia bacterium]